MSNENTVYTYLVNPEKDDTYSVCGIAQVGNQPLVSIEASGLSLIEALSWLNWKTTTIEEWGEHVWSGEGTDCAGQLLDQAKFAFWENGPYTPEERLEIVPFTDHLLGNINAVSFISLCLGLAHQFGSPAPLKEAPVGLQLYLQNA